jgi:hypothetical protein
VSELLWNKWLPEDATDDTLSKTFDPCARFPALVRHRRACRQRDGVLVRRLSPWREGCTVDRSDVIDHVEAEGDTNSQAVPEVHAALQDEPGHAL